VFKFKPFGPFEIPIVDGEVAKTELNDFWKTVEGARPGLQDAVGCYIFATYTRDTARPWYVGKTEKASFKREAFQLQKLEHYRTVLKTHKRGISQLYLIISSQKCKKPADCADLERMAFFRFANLRNY
jgi:hypothetical protein